MLIVKLNIEIKREWFADIAAMHPDPTLDMDNNDTIWYDIILQFYNPVIANYFPHDWTAITKYHYR